MEFTIEVKWFEGEYSSTWRGRAVPHMEKAPLNFQIPLPEAVPISRVEAATVYELSQILPKTSNTGTECVVNVTTNEARQRILSDESITDNFSDMTLVVQVTDEG